MKRLTCILAMLINVPTFAAVAPPQPVAPAQPAATTPSASTGPSGEAARPAPRRAVVVPPGFAVVTAGPRHAICEPADATWVRAALEGLTPTTLPSTMPSDLVQRIVEHRDLLKVRLSSDLALPDGAPVDAFLSQTLTLRIGRVEAIEPPIFMLVCSDARLKEIVRGGWDEPRFHYNRVADEVAYNPDMRLSEDAPMDDVVLPAIYKSTMTDTSLKRQRLAEEIHRSEAGVADALSRRAMVVAQMSFIEFIHVNAIEPLHLKQDQMWFAMGVEAVLSARYIADLAGLDANDLLARITRDNPRNPIRSATIDLLHPTDRAAMRQEWIPAYEDAYRAKSTRVVADWMKTSGESAVATVLGALRRKTPDDGAGLIRLIQTTTNVDLTDAAKGN